MAAEREWARKLNAAQLESLQKVAEAELYAKGKAAEAEAVSWARILLFKVCLSTAKDIVLRILSLCSDSGDCSLEGGGGRPGAGACLREDPGAGGGRPGGAGGGPQGGAAAAGLGEGLAGAHVPCERDAHN